MDYTLTAIMAVVILTCIGLVFGFVLASADKKFAMEENPLIGEVKEALPQGQCGACGFAGCAKYAEAVVLDPDVPPNLCVPGKAAVAAVVEGGGIGLGGLGIHAQVHQGVATKVIGLAHNLIGSLCRPKHLGCSGKITRAVSGAALLDQLAIQGSPLYS